MAITINGSGTITGISAGGLPDGSVTAADIESSLDLSGKTVTLPSGTGGKVLQVVQGTLLTAASTTSTSMTDTGLSVSITPTSASSKVMVFVHLNGCYNTNSIYNGHAQLVRNSTAIGNTNANFSILWQGNSARTGSFVINWLDSPTTTSSTTYKVQFNSEGGGTTAYVSYGNTDNLTSTITAMEIAG